MRISEKAKERIKCMTSSFIIFVVIGVLFFLVFTPHIILNSLLNNRVESKVFNSESFNIESEQITLTTKDGLNLAAYRTRATNSKGTIIILSGIEEPSITAFFGYAKMFADNGWDSLLIEMRAHNQSEGEELGLGYLEVRDLIAGVDFISSDSEVAELPIVAMGTSMGASTAIMATDLDPRIDGTIFLAAFSSWPDVFVDNMMRLEVPKTLTNIEKPFIKLHAGIKYGFKNTQISPQKALNDFNGRPLH